MFAIIGAVLVAIAIPDIRTYRFILRVSRKYPDSIALDAYRVAMGVIALVGVVFAILGLNTTLGVLLTDTRSLWASGAGLFLLIGVALFLKVPGAYFRDGVNRLVARAEAGEFDEPSLDNDPRVPR